MPIDPVLSKLQALCVKREYCSYDIALKATRLLKDVPDAGSRVDELVESLEKDGFVSDYRYSCAYAREKSAISGWGPIKIRMALLAKKIDKSVIDSALCEMDEERANGRLKKLLASKWRSLSDDPQGKLKLIRFALSRGYEYDSIRAVVEDITSTSD